MPLLTDDTARVRHRAGWAEAALGFCALLLLMDLAVAVQHVRLGSRLAAGGEVTDPAVDFAHQLDVVVGSALAAASVAACIGVVWWTYACCVAVERDGGRLRYPARWGWLGWLVPGLNLYRPPRLLGSLDAAGRPERGRSIWIWPWWLVFLLAVGLDRLVELRSLGELDAEAYRDVAVLQVGVDVIDLFAVAGAALVVGSVTRRLLTRLRGSRAELAG